MSSSAPASARQFATTRWTAVLAAAKADSPHATEALDQLKACLAGDRTDQP